jgi:hypothetical protein
MRTVAAVVGCLALTIGYAAAPLAGDQPQDATVAKAEVSATQGDELHFVSILTVHGEVVAVDPSNRLVTVKGSNGHSSKLEVRDEKGLGSIKTGDRVVAHYFEGARIDNKKLPGAIAAASLNEGIIGIKPGETENKEHALVASVKGVDAGEQEITIKGEDGSIETIIVANPEYLKHIKVGHRVVITVPQALALSIEKES